MYFAAYSEGRQHREQVDEVVAAEGIDVAAVMRKAFEFYYKAHYVKAGEHEL